MKTIDMREATIYLLRIPGAGELPLSRRERERMAVESIIREVFGSEAALRHDAFGAPYLDGTATGTFISVSHSASTACVAVRNGSAVGVDIETGRSQLRSVAARFLSPDEQAIFTSDTALLTAWTSKEAAFKAASEPRLVISDIRLSDDMTSAATPSGQKFALRHRPFGDNSLITIAIPNA